MNIEKLKKEYYEETGMDWYDDIDGTDKLLKYIKWLEKKATIALSTKGEFSAEDMGEAFDAGCDFGNEQTTFCTQFDEWLTEYREKKKGDGK